VPAPPVELPRVGLRFHSEGRGEGWDECAAHCGWPDPDWARFVMDFDYSWASAIRVRKAKG
jgi:hypothetical protein